MKQSGRVVEDGRGTEWRVQVFWPSESAYLMIAWLDAEYRRAIVGVPSRCYVWVLSRAAALPEEELAAITRRVAGLGYDTSLLRRVSQSASAD